MIRISKNLQNIPESLVDKQCTDREEIKPRIYGAKDVRARLKGLYHNKCAYCESTDFSPEVEHYRPKRGVTGSSASEHGGYFWLAYEWSNLLPSCHKCNTSGAKGNHFPIEGVRKNKPDTDSDGSIETSSNNFLSDYLQEEKALLIHPEEKSFDPFLFFAFSFDTKGEMLPKGSEFEYRRAVITIENIKLNREELLGWRKSKLDAIAVKLKEYLSDYLKKEISDDYFKKSVNRILDSIQSSSKTHKEYSFFWSFLYKNFGKYIAANFKGKQRYPFINIFIEHRNNS